MIIHVHRSARRKSIGNVPAVKQSMSLGVGCVHEWGYDNRVRQEIAGVTAPSLVFVDADTSNLPASNQGISSVRVGARYANRDVQSVSEVVAVSDPSLARSWALRRKDGLGASPITTKGGVDNDILVVEELVHVTCFPREGSGRCAPGRRDRTRAAQVPRDLALWEEPGLDPFIIDVHGP